MPINTFGKRYQELDAMRGIAAMLVVFVHFNPVIYWLQFGITGVDLFFIISGFVIFMSLSKVNNSLDFIINRVSRLYPTYWVVVTFTFILISVSVFRWTGHFNAHSILDYLANMTMFHFYFGVKDLDGPYWTLIIEMLFYIWILLLYKFRWLKHINKISIVLIVGTVILTGFFYPVNFVQQLISNVPLLQFFPLFFAGIVFYKIYTGTGSNYQNYLMIILCFACQTALYQYAGWTHLFISHIRYIIMLSIYFSLFTLFVNNKLKFIVNKVTLFLGKISYALYLSHLYLSVHLLLPFLMIKLHINFWIAAIFIVLPIIISLAFLITHFIEIPFRKKMKAKLHEKLDPIFNHNPTFTKA